MQGLWMIKGFMIMENGGDGQLDLSVWASSSQTSFFKFIYLNLPVSNWELPPPPNVSLGKSTKLIKEAL